MSGPQDSKCFNRQKTLENRRCGTEQDGFKLWVSGLSPASLPSLRFPCGAVAPRSLRSFATLHTTSMSVVGHAAPKSYYRLPAINATGRPALGRRRSRLRSLKADLSTLAALVDSRLSVSLRARSTLRPAAAAESAKRQRLNPKALNTLLLNTSACRYPWPTLRRRYGPVLATLASSLRDFHVRRSDAIRAPGLAWAATSMIAAGYQSISYCQSQSQPALQAGQVRHQVGPMFRRDSTGCDSVESSARRFAIRLKTENQV